MVFGTQLELLDLTGKCSLHLLYHCIFVHSTTTHVLSCYLYYIIGLPLSLLVTCCGCLSVCYGCCEVVDDNAVSWFGEVTEYREIVHPPHDHNCS